MFKKSTLFFLAMSMFSFSLLAGKKPEECNKQQTQPDEPKFDPDWVPSNTTKEVAEYRSPEERARIRKILIWLTNNQNPIIQNSAK